MTIGDKKIVKLYAGKEISAAYVGDKNVFQNYYGVSFPLTGPADTRLTRIGYMPWHRELPIQSNMKTCTVTENGTVKYLNATDRTKYEDGTARDMSLDTMVEIPQFWYKCMHDDTNVYLMLYPSKPNIPDVVEVKKFYMGAYEGVVKDNKLMSINDGVSVPTVTTTRTTFQQKATAKGSGWSAYTYKAHIALTILYLVEYACSNSQLAFNSALTAEGYKQGGLGAGVTGGSVTKNGVTAYSFVPCGTTDSLGNGTGIVSFRFTNTDAEGNETSTTTKEVPSYRGIENPFGHVWKNCVDILIHYNAETTNNDVYTCTSDKYTSTNINDYAFTCSTSTREGYKKKLIYDSMFNLFPPTDETFGANTTTYWCDYNYSNTSTTDRTLLIGGCSGDGGVAGLLALYSYYALGYSSATVGTRNLYVPQA